MNYANETPAAMQYVGSALGSSKLIDSPRTIGENIDSRIKMHEAEIARLRSVKAQLSDGTPLLNIRIDDLRQAMNY